MEKEEDMIPELDWKNKLSSTDMSGDEFTEMAAKLFARLFFQYCLMLKESDSSTDDLDDEFPDKADLLCVFRR